MTAGWLAWVVLAMVGATVGSFLNVVIYRLPQRLSLVHPPSHCFSCGARLGVADLVPVLSWLALRGRCRHCGRRFSARYPLVEALTGALAVGAGYYWGLTPYALGVFVACCALLVAFWVDLDHMIIPDQVPVLLAGLGVAFDVYRLATVGAEAAVRFPEPWGGALQPVLLPASVVGMAVGGGGFLAIGWVFERLLGRPALGLGDVKLAAGVGALWGPGRLFLAFFLLAVVAGALLAGVLMAVSRGKRRHYLPFGPMLAAAAVALLLWPDVLGPWVMSFYGG